MPGAELALVYDAVPELGARTRAPVARSLEELLASPAVDAVAICTTTDTHVDLIVAAAQAGKHIFCEKPISLDLAEVDRALAAVERAGVLLQIGFNRRFDAGHRWVHDAVAEGLIGELHLVRISSRDPAPPPLDYLRVSGGIFLDMTIHDFDMARFVSGSDVVEVFARGAARVDPMIGAIGDVDTAVVTLVHSDGTMAVIDNSRQAVYGYDQRVEAFGSAGAASSENPSAHAGVIRTARETRSSNLLSFFVQRYLPSYAAGWGAFVEAIHQCAPSPVPGSDGRASLVIGLAAARSLAEGGPVRVAAIA